MKILIPSIVIYQSNNYGNNNIMITQGSKIYYTPGSLEADKATRPWGLQDHNTSDTYREDLLTQEFYDYA